MMHRYLMVLCVGVSVTAFGWPQREAHPEPPTRAVLDRSTYLGGNDLDWAYNVKVDDTGNVYVSGYTTSPDFPTRLPILSGPASRPQALGFVTKLDPAGGLVYSTTRPTSRAFRSPWRSMHQAASISPEARATTHS
jgi:hypothetical protein